MNEECRAILKFTPLRILTKKALFDDSNKAFYENTEGVFKREAMKMRS